MSTAIWLATSPAASRATKALLSEVAQAPASAATRERCCEVISQLRVSEQGQAGLAAFFAGTPAPWVPYPQVPHPNAHYACANLTHGLVKSWYKTAAEHGIQALYYQNPVRAGSARALPRVCATAPLPRWISPHPLFARSSLNTALTFARSMRAWRATPCRPPGRGSTRRRAKQMRTFAPACTGACCATPPPTWHSMAQHGIVGAGRWAKRTPESA